MTPPSEPRNPLYLLLLLASLLFVATALAYAIIPTLQDKAVDAGAIVPPSEFRDALRRDGGTWLLCELAAMVAFGFASMWLDGRRLRRLQKHSAPATMPQAADGTAIPSSAADSHEKPGEAHPGAKAGDRTP